VKFYWREKKKKVRGQTNKKGATRKRGERRERTTREAASFSKELNAFKLCIDLV